MAAIAEPRDVRAVDGITLGGRSAQSQREQGDGEPGQHTDEDVEAHVSLLDGGAGEH